MAARLDYLPPSVEVVPPLPQTHPVGARLEPGSSVPEQARGAGHKEDPAEGRGQVNIREAYTRGILPPVRDPSFVDSRIGGSASIERPSVTHNAKLL